MIQMSSSSFTYNWDNVIHVMKKIYSIIHFKYTKCVLYTMNDYPNHPFIVQKEISNVF